MPRDLDRNYSSLSAFGSALKAMIDQQKIVEKLTPHEALSLWPEIAGKQIAAVCEAEAVRGKTLFVRAKSSVWANELTFYKPDLLKKLNEKLAALAGPGAAAVIEDIFFSTGNRSTSPNCAKAKKAEPKADRPDLSNVGTPAIPSTGHNGEARIESLAARAQSILEWKRCNGWIECSRCQALYEPEIKQAAIKRRRSTANKIAGVCPICRILMAR